MKSYISILLLHKQLSVNCTMRQISLFIVLLSFFAASGQDTTKYSHYQLTGEYINQNLYVQNPILASDTGFCVQKITVNKLDVAFDHLSAFELRLKDLGLDSGQNIVINFYHQHDCLPKVLFQEIPYTYELFISNLKISPHGLLTWNINKFPHSSAFDIEIYRWNAWQRVATLYPNDTVSALSYRYLASLHSGQNKIRVVLRRLMSTKIITTDSHIINNPIPPVTITQIDRKQRTIMLSTETDWWLLDHHENVVNKGRGDIVQWKTKNKHPLYLHYDNKLKKISSR